jgi:FAD/FMN-containing dehydrogenase
MARCCAPARENADLFGWTLGGMGLAGIILRAAIRLTRVESGWIRQTQSRAHHLAEAIEQFEAAQDATYSVAWIDCLASGASTGRSLVMLGEHALLEELGPRPAKDASSCAAARRRRCLSIFPASRSTACRWGPSIWPIMPMAC